MFTGCGTALVTPFRRDGSFDEAAMRRLVKRQIEMQHIRRRRNLVLGRGYDEIVMRRIGPGPTQKNDAHDKAGAGRSAIAITVE